jgi:hypothetical protein
MIDSQCLINVLCFIKARERERSCKAAKQRSFNDYDWKTIIPKGEHAKLTVLQLDKYLSHNNLPKTGKKGDKVKRISYHFFTSQSSNTVTTPKCHGEDEHEPDSESSLESSDDEVQQIIPDTDDLQESSSSSDSDDGDIVVTTRSGRQAGSWKNCFQW